MIITDMEETNNIGISVHPFSHSLEFDGKISEDVSPCLRATDYKAPHCVWECNKVITNKTDSDMESYASILQLPHGYKGWSEYENVCPTITTSSFEHNNFVKTDSNMEQEFKTVVGSKQENAYSGSVEDVSPTLTSAMGMGGGMIPMLTDASIEETKTDNFKKQERLQLPKELEGKKFRIRKLTPTECMRLQDVDDEDIKKMIDSGLSNSALYKLAGNSITISPLYHIFRKMFIDTENENQQLSLF